MKLEEALEKVKNGTATGEEEAFVDKELKDFIAIKNIIDNPPVEPVVARTDRETVGKAIKLFQRKSLIRLAVTVLICLAAIAMIVCAIIFIPACRSAGANQRIERDEAIVMAQDFLEQKGIDVAELEIFDVDKEMRIFGSLNNAFYAYEIEFRSETDIYGVSVGTQSGHVYLVFHKAIQ